MKNLKRVLVDKAKLSSVGDIVIYDVQGTATYGGGFFSQAKEIAFKIQISAADARVVGYDLS
jgi:hypothetical protein